MKTIHNIICGLVVTASGCMGLTSCNSFLEEYSQDLAKVNSWEDLDELLIGSAYIHTGRSYDTGASYYETERDFDLDFLHFMTDETYLTESTGSDPFYYYQAVFPFYTWQQDTGTDYMLRYAGNDEVYWNGLYERINVCNMVISVIDEQPAPTEIDEVQKRRVKGEAHFLRGLYYFTLANLYCEPYDPATAESKVGLPIKYTEVVEDKEFDRENLKETYLKILNDLSVAEEFLEGTTRKSIYRADLTTTRLLMSRVYLYMQDWPAAITKAKEVLSDNSALLSLSTRNPGESCVDASSPEVIFSMGDYIAASLFNDSRRTAATWLISDEMMELYSPSDLRGTRYVGESQYGRPKAFRKYNGQREAWGPYNSVGSVFLFRTPEAYLILAEAAAYNGDEATARTTLEKFLATRMSGKVSVNQSGNELIDFIREERAREFIIEGHRWFDLRRYTVCAPYPWSKTIEHGYNYFATVNYDTVLDHTDWYRLEKNDGAYTLPIPRAVRNFQISLGNAARPARVPYLVTTSTAGGDDDDDWNDDDWDW